MCGARWRDADPLSLRIVQKDEGHRDPGDRRSSGDGILPLQFLPLLLRESGECLPLVEGRRRNSHEGKEFVGHLKKTEMSDRQLCTPCGGHLTTHHPTFGLTDVHAAVPRRVTFEPVIHLHYAEAVLPMKDGLRKLRDFPVEAEDPASWFPSSGAREATDKQRQCPALRALYAHTR